MLVVYICWLWFSHLYLWNILKLTSRKHTPHTLADFKPGIMKTTKVAYLSLDHSLPDGLDEECIEEDSGTSLDWNNEDQALSSDFEQEPY